MMNGDRNLGLLAENYDRDGVVLVRGFLNGSQLKTLEESLSYARLNPGPMRTNFMSSLEGEFFFDFMTFRRNPYIKELCFDEGLGRTLSQIVGTNELRIFHDNILIKSGDAPPTPWHQDRPHYLVEGPNNFSVWMSPDVVPENESLAFIPGSHKSGKIYHSRSFRDGEEISENLDFESLSVEEFDRLSEQGIIVFSCRPGDAIIFDNRMLHSALRGNAPANRRALSLRFIGDGALLTTKYADATPPLHLMGMKFKDGDLPSEVWFPTVYRKT
jgi:ectoine hydroxylase-related dioxygenase (phytanoyl-CoA dioxygenase family)